MNSKTVPARQAASSADIAKFVVAGALVVAGVFAFYWFQGEWANWMRVAAVLGGLVLGAVVFMTSTKGPQLRGLAVVAGLLAGTAVFLVTAKGRDVREFLSESRFELRKVVWPTRQETTRMAWVVIIVVVIVSLTLAGFDFVVQKAIQWFLGR